MSTFNEFLVRFTQGHPRCVTTDALSVLNEAGRAVWGAFPWKRGRTSYEKTCVRSMDNGRVDSASAQVYSLIEGLFSEDDVGGTLTITAGDVTSEVVTATIVAYVSANQVTIDTPWAYDSQNGDVVLTVASYTFALPTDFRRIERVRIGTNERDLLDPHEYEYSEIDGAKQIRMSGLRPSLDEAVEVIYYRDYTAVTGPGSSVDGADELEEAMYQAWRLKLLSRWIPGTEFEVEARRTWLAEAKAAATLALEQAKARENLAHRRENRNARRGLSRGRRGYVVVDAAE